MYMKNPTVLSVFTANRNSAHETAPISAERQGPIKGLLFNYISLLQMSLWVATKVFAIVSRMTRSHTTPLCVICSIQTQNRHLIHFGMKLVIMQLLSTLVWNTMQSRGIHYMLYISDFQLVLQQHILLRVHTNVVNKICEKCSISKM